MADKDFNKELEDSSVYKIAHAIGIDISTYKANSEDQLKNAEAEIKQAIKKRQYENTETQNAADLKKLEDKPQLQEQYKEIKKEEKPNPEAEKDKAEQKADDKSKEEKTSMGDLLRRLSGRPNKASADQTQMTEIPNLMHTAAKTLNTSATMINNIYKARKQRNP